MNLFRIMNIKGKLIDVLFTSASKGDNRRWPSYQCLSCIFIPLMVHRVMHNEMINNRLRRQSPMLMNKLYMLFQNVVFILFCKPTKSVKPIRLYCIQKSCKCVYISH